MDPRRPMSTGMNGGCWSRRFRPVSTFEARIVRDSTAVTIIFGDFLVVKM
jgi:hypothetical protein